MFRNIERVALLRIGMELAGRNLNPTHDFEFAFVCSHRKRMTVGTENETRYWGEDCQPDMASRISPKLRESQISMK